jgi:hypothetical protein
MSYAHVRSIVSRVAFVAGNLLLVFALYSFVASPILTLFTDHSEKLRQLEAALAKAQAIAAQENALKSATAQIRSGAASGFFLTGASSGAMSADFQGKLKDLLSQSGTHVQSIRVEDPFTENGIRYIAAHVQVTGTVGAVRDALSAIETTKPYTFVKSAFLRLPSQVPGFTSPVEPPLEAELTVVVPTWSQAEAR